jgi:hypothetical protein
VKVTDVSEGNIASVFRIEEYVKRETTMKQVTNKNFRYI